MKKIFLSQGADAQSRETATQLKVILQQYGFHLFIAESAVTFGDPMWEVVQDAIKQAWIVIALMVRPSANVFYEMGYATGIGKRVIILADSESRLPSDLSSVSMIRFDHFDSSCISRLLDVLQRESDSDVNVVDYWLRDHRLSRMPEKIFEIYRDHPGTFERIDDRSFEEAVRNLFLSQQVKVEAPSSNSFARFDFLIHDFEGKRTSVVEVKKYNASAKISVGQIQQLLGAVVAERADSGILIAPSEFTRTAADFASRCNPRIELWNMEELQKRLAPRLVTGRSNKHSTGS